MLRLNEITPVLFMLAMWRFGRFWLVNDDQWLQQMELTSITDDLAKTFKVALLANLGLQTQIKQGKGLIEMFV
jgi:hypothetical protein